MKKSLEEEKTGKKKPRKLETSLKFQGFMWKKKKSELRIPKWLWQEKPRNRTIRKDLNSHHKEKKLEKKWNESRGIYKHRRQKPRTQKQKLQLKLKKTETASRKRKEIERIESYAGENVYIGEMGTYLLKREDSVKERKEEASVGLWGSLCVFLSLESMSKSLNLFFVLKGVGVENAVWK